MEMHPIGAGSRKTAPLERATCTWGAAVDVIAGGWWSVVGDALPERRGPYLLLGVAKVFGARPAKMPPRGQFWKL
jgi:hypothetical protein